jgi:leucyl/phenylalanyl-tRNA--protein transferase
MSLITEDGHQQPDPMVDLVRQGPPGEPLSPFLVMMFYAKGIFPWLHSEHAQRLWWSPEPRSILILSEIHISRSLRKTLCKTKLKVTADTSFEQVVRLCGITREMSWISEEVVQVFTTLHELGHAHSIEVWDGDQLVGGLYGVCVGQMFYGCSMFHTKRDASKIALVRLAERLSEWGFPMIDCQLHNPHLQRMGARLLPRENFHQIVHLLVRGPRRLGSWTPFFT